MTNKEKLTEKLIEKLKNMSNEELARILSVGCSCRECPIENYCRAYCGDKSCEKLVLSYLNEEDEEQNDK